MGNQIFNNINIISSSEEYISLREELLQDKKYVLERSLFISTVLIASNSFFEGQNLFLLPFFSIALLLFNLWFTVDRLENIALIAAYIQLVHENPLEIEYIRWESFLRHQRKWIKITDKNNKKKLLKQHIDKDVVGKMYYPPIFYLHFFMILISIIYSFFNCFNKSIHTILISIISIIFGLGSLYFIFYIKKWNPKNMENIIEKQRAICICILSELKLIKEKNIL